ncbi:MAG: hypothetical protein JWM44_1668 [Bacilli bacterium]|nr:hypothetical protein [Bacilli bacterium]
MLHEDGKRKVKIRLWGKTGVTRGIAGLSLALCLIVSGCGGSSSKDAASTSQAAPAAAGSEAKMADSSAYQLPVSNESAKDVSTGKTDADNGKVTSGTTGFAVADSNASLDRKVIYKGNLTMAVADYTAAQTEIDNLVVLSRGYVLQFSENQSTTEQSGNFVIKVPANGFSSFIRDLEKIKTVTPIRHNIQGQDVSEEYVDLSSRLKAKQVVEARLIAFMDKSTKTDELLAFSKELATVQEAIEQIKGRMRYLDQNVSYSTVEIKLYQQGANTFIANEGTNESLLTRSEHTLQASLHVLKVIGQGIVIFLAAVLPVLIVLIILGFPVVYLLRKRLRRMAITENPASYLQKIDTVDQNSSE